MSARFAGYCCAEHQAQFSHPSLRPVAEAKACHSDKAAYGASDIIDNLADIRQAAYAEVGDVAPALGHAGYDHVRGVDTFHNALR